ncbi:TPA: site-specific integrase, partial [Enterococcus faecalis]|nr:site-specific integrase [Enterococcus faecalis]
MSKRPRLFAGYFLEWIETYKVGAIRDISVSKYYIAHKHLTEICPDLTIDKLDRKAYQSILNEYALTHERQTTMD